MIHPVGQLRLPDFSILKVYNLRNKLLKKILNCAIINYILMAERIMYGEQGVYIHHNMHSA